MGFWGLCFRQRKINYFHFNQITPFSIRPDRKLPSWLKLWTWELFCTPLRTRKVKKPIEQYNGGINYAFRPNRTRGRCQNIGGAWGRCPFGRLSDYRPDEAAPGNPRWGEPHRPARLRFSFYYTFRWTSKYANTAAHVR